MKTVLCAILILCQDSLALARTDNRTDNGEKASVSEITFVGRPADRIIDRLLGKQNQKQTIVEDCKTSRPSDCGVLAESKCSSGIYTIYPYNTDGFDVYCDMDTDGGGWTVFQRRQDGSVNFYRTWDKYKKGFGSLDGEFWLGNDHIHQITSQGFYSLRVGLEDFDNNHKYAKYSMFSIGPESSDYQIKVNGYSGDAGDSLHVRHNGMKFSTKDKDNDLNKSAKSCAEQFKGAWWYNSCHFSNLNGQYLRGNHTTFADGVNWYHWLGARYSLKTTTMMIKRE